MHLPPSVLNHVLVEPPHCLLHTPLDLAPQCQHGGDGGVGSGRGGRGGKGGGGSGGKGGGEGGLVGLAEAVNHLAQVFEAGVAL